MSEYVFIPPKLYRKQHKMVFGKERYSVIEASTKSGKTVAMIVWIFWKALQGKAGQNCWWVAPIYSQTKIAFRRMIRFVKNKKLFVVNNSELTITLINGVTIAFKSAEKPDNLYGEDVIAAVIDEGSRCRPESWYAIRSTITATRGSVKIIGNVTHSNNWMYRLGEEVRNGELPNWKYYMLTCEDAVKGGVLEQSEIDDARRTLPEDVFNALYMCKPFDDRGRPFIWAFDEKNNVIDYFQYNKDINIYISFDFNVDPITCIVAQHTLDKQRIVVFDEFKLPNSNIYELCERIKVKYPVSLPIVVNADATGRNRTALSNLNYLQVIQRELMVSNYNMQVSKVNPYINNSRLLTNSLFAKHPFCVVAKNCTNLINDIKYVQVNDSGDILKDRSKEFGKADLLDCLRYYFWSNFNDFLKKNYYS